MPSQRTRITTPESLAGPFADLACRRLEKWSAAGRGGGILDPGCGSGLFLNLMMERLPHDQGYSFCGIEVDEALARLAAQRLVHQNLKIYHGDFLFDGWREVRNGGAVWNPETQTFRAVIGNPPYLGFKSQGAALRRRLSLTYGPGFGKCDLSGFSMMRSIQLVEPGGLIALILPRYWLEGGTGKALRDQLIRECDIVEIRQWPGGHLFPGAGVQVLGLWARKRHRPGSTGKMHYYLMPENSMDGDPLDRRSMEYSKTREPWPLLLKSEERFLEILRSHGSALETWAAPAQGIITGADRSRGGGGIFVLDPEEVDDLKWTREERRFLFPWIKSRQLEPLRVGKTPASLLHLPPETDLALLPGIRRHLLKYKSHLERRREVAKGRIPWWSLQWGRKEELFRGARILTPAKARIVRAAAAPEGIRFSADIYTWRLCEGVLRRFEGVTARQAVFWLALYLSSRPGRIASRLLGKKLGSVVELYPQTQRLVPVPVPDSAGWRRISQGMEGWLSPQGIAACTPDELYLQADDIVASILRPTAEEKDLMEEIESIWDPPVGAEGHFPNDIKPSLRPDQHQAE
ncbi:MAG: SAM-dependent methyltransferase [Candidatus Eisenbacteria bacterium]|uniref:site-specific DNA-methyltransferase (adenine-specific) n=1 Tax=Eiseniibacteriota bacterium TaxID=2212470 RepID=A0A948RWW4_UNCEI|nr:SAM-dependent methyltransferase [Candidatus Eisenbacteria bacterium]MBU1947326.1 SAM-dependent methyltransferase [Candidatus Eisenbacteria bacterium]MBU2690522.1 SAM-dependent methyltransferase [Candidatus Eisenbacteria bacterium]